MSLPEEEKKREIEGDIEKLSSMLEDLMRSLQEPALEVRVPTPKEAIQKSLHDRFDVVSRKMSDGFKMAMESLIDLGRYVSEPELAACTRSLAEVSMIHEIIDKHWNLVLEKMAKGEEISAALGISYDGLQGMYALGRMFFEHQHFDEAVSCFCLLSLLAPEQEIFWLGLGHSEYCLGRFKDAMIAYTMASEVATQDPAPHLFMAHCFRAMKEDMFISHCFMLAEQAASTEGVKREVRESVQRLKEAWKL